MNHPSRLTFWRIVLFASAILLYMAAWDFLRLAQELGVTVPASRSWMGLLSLLVIGGLTALLALSLILRSSTGQTRFRSREQILSLLEFPARVRWLGFLLLALALTGYTIVYSLPSTRDFIGDLGWVRFLVFWAFSLLGMYGLRAVKEDLSWFTSLVVVALLQTSLHVLVTQLFSVTPYPFAMGWSETSRFYYPSLFLSERIFGNRLPWPILHPSLHLLLVPPYLVDAPLWFHRFWQAFLRFALLGLAAQALLWRLSFKKVAFRWLLWLWMFLFLFQGPVYFHLAVPLALMLWGFSARDDRRTWVFLILAAIWSGLSRINWYPMPGILASVLFLLEVPYQGKSIWRYLLKPVLWTVTGFAIAFATQRIYIAISGIPDPEFFYTSLTSNLLCYRLFPNASYSVGVLPAALIASLPAWGAIFLALRRHGGIHPLRLGLILAALLALFAGGLVVSMKIGGGVDIHNLDAYLSLLLIVTAYVVFGKYASEPGKSTAPLTLPWGLALLLVALPAWFLLGTNGGLKVFDPVRTQSVLDGLQSRVNTINAQGGEILFITQRHLVSMHMIDHVEMVPEYEREELMEMAMGDNQDYLQIFAADMERQRFDAIVVDPLTYRLLGRNYVFGEENNAWVRRVMKPILCNYEEDVVFPADQVAIYVPQEGLQKCP
jgi:hypothetical protein